ncbi:hypothetical protein T492DRAFT_884705 [Pavlovales sp. CCMP2436]|nr:hypothetical protein T492DRAFT_884705 [Pavlovales sp. CCMP2436]
MANLTDAQLYPTGGLRQGPRPRTPVAPTRRAASGAERGLTDAQLLRALAFAVERAAAGECVSVLAAESGDEGRWRELALVLAGDGLTVRWPRTAEGVVVTLAPHPAELWREAGLDLELAALLADCRLGRLQSARHLLERVPVDAADADGITALHAASRGGHVELARLLLEAGAAVDRSDGKGGTSLMRACRHGHAGVARLLLAAGAQPDARQRDGHTALMLGARGGHDGVVRVLCEAGADPGLCLIVSHGATAHSLATGAGHLAVRDVLRAHGARDDEAGEAAQPLHHAYTHAWWYRPLHEGARVAERLPARPPRRLAEAPTAMRYAQRLIDEAERRDGLPHDGGPWRRTRAVAEVVAAEAAGMRARAARGAAVTLEEARRMAWRASERAAEAHGRPLPYHFRPLGGPEPALPAGRARVARTAPAHDDDVVARTPWELRKQKMRARMLVPSRVKPRPPPSTRAPPPKHGQLDQRVGQTMRLERRHAQLVARLDVQLDARFNLTRIMRCIDDHVFARVQSGMSSTTSMQPDEGWRFAPVGVLSHLDGQLDGQLGQLVATGSSGSSSTSASAAMCSVVSPG